MKRDRRLLLAWYRKHSRQGLPWRSTKDPYRIWISEAMLQQTQVAKVIPYYERFLKRFPTVQALAEASPLDVLDAWAGLGYYTRAKNLRAAAQKILAEHAGRLPESVDRLMELPGIGRYTAGAIASIAYDRPAPILDGNVIRVLTRRFGIPEDPRRPEIQRRLWELAAGLVPGEAPGDLNQAMMELGALVCTPRQPACGDCPWSNGCVARQTGRQEQIPAKTAAAPRKNILYLCGVIEKKGRLLLARRPLEGLMPGLWEFPGADPETGGTRRTLGEILTQRLGVEASVGEPAGRVRQILSHREIDIRAFFCRLSGAPRAAGYPEIKWFPRKTVTATGLTAGMLRLAKSLPLLLCAAWLAGCATPSPKLDKGELQAAHDFYEVKALRHAYTQVMRVRTAGARLLTSVPKEDRPAKSKPEVGLMIDNLTLNSSRVFGIPGMEPNLSAKNRKDRAPWRWKEATVVAGVLPNSPADKAGLRPGDLLLKINGKKTTAAREAAGLLGKLKPEDKLVVDLEREGQPFKRTISVESKPFPVVFSVVDSEAVNAFASPGHIAVTSGMLRFIKSDDELSVVMGHELAHLTKGHYSRKMGTDVIAGVIGAAAGVAVDIVVPGAGGLISQITSGAMQAPFSQDFEREADSAGLAYAHGAGYRAESGLEFWDRFATELPKSLSKSFFNTHPSSPERLLRMEKTIEELKKGKKAS